MYLKRNRNNNNKKKELINATENPYPPHTVEACGTLFIQYGESPKTIKTIC